MEKTIVKLLKLFILNCTLQRSEVVNSVGMVVVGDDLFLRVDAL